MKKRNLRAVFASLLAASAVVGLASCGKNKDKEPSNPDQSETGDDETTNYTVTFNSNGGSSVASQTVKSGNKATSPTNPTKAEDEYKSYTFEGWYSDEALTTAYDFTAAVTANVTLYAKWTETALTESIKLSMDMADAVTAQGGAGKVNDDISLNGFTVEAGAETRARAKSWTKTGNYTFTGVDLSKLDLYDMNDGSTSKSFTHSVKINDKAGVKLTATGNGTVKAYVQCGSGGTGLTGSLGVKVVGSDDSEEVIYIPTKDTYNSPIVQISFEAKSGVTYQILRQGSGTVDLYGAEVDLVGEKSPVVGIEITSKGSESFFEGETFNTTGLSVVTKKSNGATSPINASDLTVTLTKDGVKADNLNTAGNYKVEVKYQEFEVQTYDVVVYSFDEVSLGYNAISKKSNSSAGNGVYFNDTVQTVYGLNDTLDLNALTVKAETEGGAYSKIIKSGSYTVSTVDMTTAGEKEVTVSVTLNGKTKSETFKIYVVDTAVTKTTVGDVEYAAVYVDAAYTGTIGALVEHDGVTCNTFKTINQALEYLGMQDGLDTTHKLIGLAPGTYKEKVEVTLPYVTIMGNGDTASDVVIEWNSLYGIKDESGYSNVTDSTATLAVRDTAKGFNISGVTISNYYNNITKYTGDYAGNGERALAMLIQADQVTVEDCRLLGWQDTLELFTGRQYFINSYICGTVDYIFGTNNTTVFEGCTIETIKSKNSYTDDSKVSAYVTAFKGTNSNDPVNYGAVFNNCNFTTSDDFVGKVALARPWAANSAVTYLNSTFSSKYSNKEVETIATGLLSNVNLDTLKLYVYNCKYADGTAFTIEEGNLDKINMNLTAEQAGLYTLANIFAKVNGSVTYDSAWDVSSSDIEDESSKTSYNFDMTEATGGVTNYTIENTLNLQSTTLELGNITLDATNGNIAYNSNSTSVNMKSGSKITLHVTAETSVKVVCFDANYNTLSINGTKFSGASYEKYFAEDTDVEILSYGDSYIKKLVVDTAAEETTRTLTSISVSGYDQNDIAVGTDLDLSGLVVKALYDDTSFEELTAEDYTVDTASVDKTTAGTYTVTVTLKSDATKTASFTQTYVAEVNDTISESVMYTYKGSTYSSDYTTVNANNASTIQLTTDETKYSKITYTGCLSNGNDNWLTFKNNATIKFSVSGECTLTIYFYNGQNCATVTLGETTISTDTDSTNATYNTPYTYQITGAGDVTITASGSGYIGAIVIAFDE